LNTKIKKSISYSDSFFRLRQHIFGIKKSFKSEEKLDNKIIESLKDRKPKIIEIKNFTIDQLDEFDKEMKKLKPIILKGGALNWECLTKWKPSFLKEQYGNTIIPLLNPDMKNQDNLKAQEESVKFSEIIDCLLTGDTSRYARFSNLMHIHPELKDDVDKSWFLNRKGKLGLGAYYSLFLGAKGTKTNLHAACSHNLFCQVLGKKHWIIISPEYDPIIKPIVSRTPYFMSNLDPEKPDLEKYPAFSLMDRYECILEEGDILFNPGSWWHKVTNLTPSIGFGFRWFDPVNSLMTSTTQTLQFIASTNPTLYTYLKDGKSFSKVINKTK
jgi:hypothetical protein